MNNPAGRVCAHVNGPVSERDDKILSILAIIGTALSLVALATALILLIKSKSRSHRTFLLYNQCITLFLAQLIFITAVERASVNPILCRVVAGLMHFLLLAVMTWMLMQGVNLLLKLRRVSTNRFLPLYYSLFAWGLPLLIVGISSAADSSIYEGESTLPGLGSLIRISLSLLFSQCNACVLVFALRTFVSVKAFRDKSEKEKFYSSARAVAILLPILGIQWILAHFPAIHVVFSYLFVIVNTTPGVFVLVFQILLNDEMNIKLHVCARKMTVSPETGTSEEIMSGKDLANRGFNTSHPTTATGTEGTSIATVSL
ncbi:adhesion G protein-coupled receptor L4-like [Diadema setosum]|uniref:adhesion G protein-coupled receptor L4-like n=1 Tax=Diadema setosum TaxID=31175 RepID=UPI003B3B8813